MTTFAAAMERRHRTQIFEKILLEDAERLRSLPKPAPVKSTVTASSPSPQRRDQSLAECRQQAARAARHGDFETAAELFDRAIRLSQGSEMPMASIFELHLCQADALRRGQRFEPAQEVLNRAAALLQSGMRASLIPQHIDLLRARATLAGSVGDMAGAEANLVEAINLCEQDEMDAPRLCRLYRELAKVYSASGHYGDAIQVILEGIGLLEGESGPQPAEKMALLQMLACITHRQGSCNAAANHLLEAYRIAEEADRQDDMAHLEAILGTLYAQHGEDEAAREWLVAAIQRLEACPGEREWMIALLHASLAQVETRLGLEQASDTFTRAVELQLQYLSSATSSN
jgi:tetratricopeptide (TPR) repeat protein